MMAIDLGTTRTRIYIRSKGVVVDEPTVIATATDSGQVIGFGSSAEEMIGRSSDSIHALRPMSGGVIAHFSAAEQLLEHFIHQAIGRWHLTRPEAMFSVPSGATSTEQRAVLDVGRRLQLRNVYVIPSGVAAALGAGQAIIEPRGHLIIDIGSDTTEISVLSLGGVVARRSLRSGGQAITDSIIRTLKRDHGISIGVHSAEEVKRLAVHIGTKTGRSITVRGRSVADHKLKTLKISAADLRPVVESTLEKIIAATRSVLEKTPPDLVSDIIEHGMVLTGGGSMLSGIDAYFSDRLNAPCRVAQDPQLCTVKGAFLALSHLQDYKRSLLGVV